MLRRSYPLLCLLIVAPSLRADDAATLWTGGVQAVLDRHCVKCHGPLEDKGGLHLDTAVGVLKGNDDGPVVTPGKPDDSKLVRALAANADPHMPPKKQLAKDEIDKLRAWVTALGQSSTTVKATAAPAPTEPTAAIDHYLAARWQALGLTPAPLSDDRTFVRRVTLDLVGRIPTPEEVEAFLYDPSATKRQTLVDRLLASDEAARNFREVWDALLMGRRGNRREARRRDGGWYAFLEAAYKQNRPWDEVVRAVVTARPEKEQDKGAIWFLFERRNEHQQIAEALAPVIYGTRIDCAQCHDHPLAAEIKQGHYWGLVAAFNRSKNAERGTPAVLESAVGGAMNFTNLKRESQPAVVTLLTGRTLDEPVGGDTDTPDKYVDPKAAVKVPKNSRRAALAEAVTHDNPLLARSFVNHTWALLMGRGIVHPVDEMNSKHPPSHPELLDALAADFASHRYDVRRLIRAIVLSRGYQLAAGSARPEAFAAALEKPLTGEAIARSLRIAAGRPADDDALRQAVVERFPDVLPRATLATAQQAMFLNSGDMIAALFRTAPERVTAPQAPADRVRAAFRLALVRDPDAEELARGVAFLTAHAATPADAAGQLLWALVSGPEFLTNH